MTGEPRQEPPFHAPSLALPGLRQAVRPCPVCTQPHSQLPNESNLHACSLPGLQRALARHRKASCIIAQTASKTAVSENPTSARVEGETNDRQRLTRDNKRCAFAETPRPTHHGFSNPPNPIPHPSLARIRVPCMKQTSPGTPPLPRSPSSKNPDHHKQLPTQRSNFKPSHARSAM